VGVLTDFNNYCHLARIYLTELQAIKNHLISHLTQHVRLRYLEKNQPT